MWKSSYCSFIFIRICRVSSFVVGSTVTFWNLLSRAPSFSIDFLYSSSVVAPIHCISPLASDGFSMFAASIEPAAEPAPIMVWISSMNSITLGLLLASFITPMILSSNSPRYFVPATSEVRSSIIIILSNSVLGTFFSAIRDASPSTMADFPTPGSPISTGLFFFLLHNIWATRSISLSRPITLSSLPSAAALVRSVPYLFNSTRLLSPLSVLPFLVFEVYSCSPLDGKS